MRAACKIASNGDPSQHRRTSLITRAIPQLRRGHHWTGNSSRKISNFRNEINALLDFEGGINVARDFTFSTAISGLAVTASLIYLALKTHQAAKHCTHPVTALGSCGFAGRFGVRLRRRQFARAASNSRAAIRRCAWRDDRRCAAARRRARLADRRR